MLVDILIFGVMATFYTYVTVPDEDEMEKEDIALENKKGRVNETFSEHM